MTQSKKFLSALLENNDYYNYTLSGINRPFVTLTYAQSLDGKISGINGKQLQLSGEESMMMTHRMRTLHDGILVGIGTVLNDDPKLTARLLEPDMETTIQQPQPIILDSSLRFPLTSKLLQQSHYQGFKKPWIFTKNLHDSNKKKILEQEGAKVITINTDESEELNKLSIKRLMVEGGAKIIQSFLKINLLDLIIVTIAPIYIGFNSVSVTGSSEGQDEEDLKNKKIVEKNFPKLINVKYEILGKDIIMTANTEK
ncbi:1059_t:CDS:2 [Entrophospora sp. SA101]|nr:13938_t:CDS:2 [Entrophospora sp. SA101]CAJ0745708.1 1059_t:CDS:2 [Entrophospora sp. SA101]